MSRPRIFVDAGACEPSLVLDGSDHHYLTRVRRLPVGAAVEIVTADGCGGLYRIEGATADRVRLAFEEQLPARKLAGVLTLIQPLLQRKKLELAVQKATELGVDRIRFTPAERSVARWDAEERSRLERLERIALEATRQCRRDAPPALDLIESLDRVGEAGPGERRLVLAEAPAPAALALADLIAAPPAGVAVVTVGPEGGFKASELEVLAGAGFEILHLGPLVLRTETASVIACVAGGLALGRYARDCP